MASLPLFNPLEVVNQFVVLIVICFVIALMIKHFDRVLVALTGDDRIHGTSLDCVWFTFFRCCGTCTGDWTRCFTKLPCCLKRCRGINLVKEIGKLLGITTYTVELKNIVVGDLPWDKRADFYLSIETSANPPMVTSLAEEKLPKVVHFPEVITLRLRWSPLEEQVRITVKELNVLGSTELCKVHISAMSVLDWSANPRDSMKRFEMKPQDLGVEYETPPWILLELSQPDDQRDLDHFHGQSNTVRTATRDGHYKDINVTQFKHQYTLLDNTGHAIQEPLEDDLRGIAFRAWLVSSIHGALAFWGLMVLMAYGAVRVYIGSCYRRFRIVTMASMNNHTFPVSSYELKSLVQQCHTQVDGAGLSPGVPCKPNYWQVMQMCKTRENGGHYPEEQPRPLAFEGLFATVGLENVGLPCNGQECQRNRQLRKYDHLIPVALGFYIFFLCAFRICGNAMVRSKTQNIQRIRAEQTRTFQEQMTQNSQARSFLAA